MKAIWKGSFSIGMVNIPVKMYKATDEQTPGLKQVHSEDGGKIKQKKVCNSCGTEVPKDEVAKGYEYAKGEYIILTNSDLENLPLKSKKSVDMKFIDKDAVSDIQHSKFYYVAPEEQGVKQFALINKMMRDRGVSAIGKIAIRGRENLAIVRPWGSGMVMTTLLYPDEVRDPSNIPMWNASTEAEDNISDKEVELAGKLVDSMKTDSISEYTDEYREALKRLIEAKINGEETPTVEEEPEKKRIYWMC